MNIKEDDIQLVIQDSPGLSWLIAAFLMGAGGLSAAGPLGLFEHSAALSLGMRLLMISLGILGIGAGSFAVRGAPLSMSVIDRKTQQVTIARRNLFGEAEAQINFSDIQNVYIVQKINPDGTPSYQIQLTLQDERTVPVSILWDRDLPRCERVAAEIQSWIRV